MHAGKMARAEEALPKRIVHFLIGLSVFVDRRLATDHERTSISVLRADPHAHRGTRYGHTNDLAHLPNGCVNVGPDLWSQTDFVPLLKRDLGEQPTAPITSKKVGARSMDSTKASHSVPRVPSA